MYSYRIRGYCPLILFSTTSFRPMLYLLLPPAPTVHLICKVTSTLGLPPYTLPSSYLKNLINPSAPSSTKGSVSPYMGIVTLYNSPTRSPPKNQAGHPLLFTLRANATTAHPSSPKLGFSRSSGFDRKALSFRYMSLSFMPGHAAACPAAVVMFVR